MLYGKKIISIICIFAVALLSVGCSRQALFPKSDVIVAGVSEFNLHPSAEGYAGIPEASISIKRLNTIPCSILSYDCRYTTCVGECIESLTINNSLIGIDLPSDVSEYELKIRPYTLRLFDLFENTESDISPVRADISILFKDCNDNYFTKDVGFLCHNYNVEKEDDNEDNVNNNGGGVVIIQNGNSEQQKTNTAIPSD